MASNYINLIIIINQNMPDNALLTLEKTLFKIDKSQIAKKMHRVLL